MQSKPSLVRQESAKMETSKEAVARRHSPSKGVPKSGSPASSVRADLAAQSPRRWYASYQRRQMRLATTYMGNTSVNEQSASQQGILSAATSLVWCDSPFQATGLLTETIAATTTQWIRRLAPTVLEKLSVDKGTDSVGGTSHVKSHTKNLRAFKCCVVLRFEALEVSSWKSRAPKQRLSCTGLLLIAPRYTGSRRSTANYLWASRATSERDAAGGCALANTVTRFILPLETTCFDVSVSLVELLRQKAMLAASAERWLSDRRSSPLMDALAKLWNEYNLHRQCSMLQSRLHVIHATVPTTAFSDPLVSAYTPAQLTKFLRNNCSGDRCATFPCDATLMCLRREVRVAESESIVFFSTGARETAIHLWILCRRNSSDLRGFHVRDSNPVVRQLVDSIIEESANQIFPELKRAAEGLRREFLWKRLVSTMPSDLRRLSDLAKELFPLCPSRPLDDVDVKGTSLMSYLADEEFLERMREDVAFQPSGRRGKSRFFHIIAADVFLVVNTSGEHELIGCDDSETVGKVQAILLNFFAICSWKLLLAR